MTTVVTRVPKGSPLSIAEMDANFNNLNNDKVDVVLPITLDMNTIDKTGFYQTGAAANRPAGSNGAGGEFVIHQKIDTNSAHQIIFFKSSNKFFTRIRNAGAWGAWVEGWTATSFPKQTTSVDTTTGAAMLVGAFGLGINTGNNLVDIDSITTPTGFYNCVNATTGTKPFGFVSNITVLVQAFDADQVTQIASETTTGRIFARTYNGSSWAAWKEFWNTSNLIKQTSSTDTTTGSMMAVGAFGLGANPVGTFGITDLNDFTNTGWYITEISGISNLPPGWAQGRYFVEVIGRTTDSYCVQRITNLSISGSSGAGVAQTSIRRMRNSGTWSNWMEYWTSNNLVKQTSSTDTTVGSVLTMGTSGFGSFGLGGYANVLPSNDLNALNLTGWFRVMSTTSNRPHSGILDGSTVMNVQYDTDDCWQLVFPREENVIYTRRQRAGAWQQWVPIGAGKVTLNSNSPTLVDQSYHINGNYTIDLPSITGLVAGKSVRFTKALASTPLIQRSGATENIVSEFGTDISLSFDLNCEIVFVFNGTDWEI